MSYKIDIFILHKSLVKYIAVYDDSVVFQRGFRLPTVQDCGISIANAPDTQVLR